MKSARPEYHARMANILIPLPARDYDPTEVAVSWQQLSARGHRVVFATPLGLPAQADPLMVTGEGLDFWGRIPGLKALKLVGLSLRANAAARAAHAALLKNAGYRQPLRWEQAAAQPFDALLLPGGHAQGMREYLESPVLQGLVASFFAANKPVAAVCHGVVLAARSRDAATGHSVLHGRKTTALTWAFEKKAAGLARFTRWWDPHYYRTYREGAGEPVGYMSVQAEVTRALAQPEDFCDAPLGSFKQQSGLFRDSPADASPAFVVRDGNYVSARWPGDVHAFARSFAEVIEAAV